MALPTIDAVSVCKMLKQCARNYQNAKMDLGCADCGRLPNVPITAYCGHTRCSECIKANGCCSRCGRPPPLDHNVDITVQDLVKKLMPPEKQTVRLKPADSAVSVLLGSQGSPGPMRNKVTRRRLGDSKSRKFSSVEIRLIYARDLIKAGDLVEAVPHLACAAAAPGQPQAFNLLVKVVSNLLKKHEPSPLLRNLHEAVRAKCTLRRLSLVDIECSICYDPMKHPVTTPCGHTFCRDCIWKTVHYIKECALCRSPLDKLGIILTKDNTFVAAALEAINSPSSSKDEGTQKISLFMCTVAYPTIPCPILVLGPCHRKIIRRILDSGIRRFGMVTAHKDGSYAVPGTIVEVRDCVQLQNGRTLLSTVGVGRFETLERTVYDGCLIASIVSLKDVDLTEEDFVNMNLEYLAQSITEKVIDWLSTLTMSILSDIEDAFGPMPHYKNERDWWKNPDSPKWLWWIIAVLPFSTDMQVLMLATIHLQKRMLAVSRSLDAIKQTGLNASVFC